MSPEKSPRDTRHLMNVLAVAVISAFTLSATAETATTASTTGTTTAAATTTVPTPKFGTYENPFAAESLWNSRPIKPVFGTFVIPKSSYNPALIAGKYSTNIYLAKATDGPMTVTGIGGGGLSDPDAQSTRTVTLPHWPADTMNSASSDGHADIYDPTTGILHSFWALRQTNGLWQAALYAWSPATGAGFGDPAHYYHGARAAGVSTSAGLIRTAEITDGLPYYRHALSMSLTYNGLSGKTPYVFPATSADWNASTTNTGGIPEGALMMLPPDYDTSKIINPHLKKIAETLKRYGAYVTDRNDGTPFAIYVEANAKTLDQNQGGGALAAINELDRMRAGMRQVISAASWVDGNGQPMTPKSTGSNALSMRGPWTPYSGTGKATFDTWTQMLSFDAKPTPTVVYNGNSSGVNRVTWGTVPGGSTQKFTVSATGGAKLRLQLYAGSKVVSDTKDLGDKDSARIVWPASGGWFILWATSGVGKVSSVRAELVTVTP